MRKLVVVDGSFNRLPTLLQIVGNYKAMIFAQGSTENVAGPLREALGMEETIDSDGDVESPPKLSELLSILSEIGAEIDVMIAVVELAIARKLPQAYCEWNELLIHRPDFEPGSIYVIDLDQKKAEVL